VNIPLQVKVSGLEHTQYAINLQILCKVSSLVNQTSKFHVFTLQLVELSGTVQQVLTGESLASTCSRCELESVLAWSQVPRGMGTRLYRYTSQGSSCLFHLWWKLRVQQKTRYYIIIHHC